MRTSWSASSNYVGNKNINKLGKNVLDAEFD